MIYFGFMPNNIEKQLFYMEVFKNEEGEILLNNKMFNGTLISKIISKKLVGDNIIEYFQNDDNDLLKFNSYSQKLKFNSSKTNNCEEGCYLLITYLSKAFKIGKITGTEFSLSCRIWNEDNYIPRIISIPLNEYIYGSFEEDNSLNHFYSVFIPGNNDAYIEIHASNVDCLAKKGITTIINIFSKETIALTSDTFDKQKLLKSLNETLILGDSENYYISFAFLKVSAFSQYSYYYFRVLLHNQTNEYPVFPLDTNKANLCKPINFGYCYFLLKNDYNILSTYYAINTYGEEAIYLFYETDEDDYYSIDSESSEINEIEMNANFPEYHITSNRNLLIVIYSFSENNLQVLINCVGDPDFMFPSLNIYSSQLFYLNTSQTKDFLIHYDTMAKYNIIINTIEGNGKICFNQRCDNTSKENDIQISEKKYLSFPLFYDSPKSIHFLCENDFFVFRIKISYQVREFLEKIKIGTTIKTNIDYAQLPKIYYLEYNDNSGIDINFKLNSNDKLDDYYEIISYGMITGYTNIKNIASIEGLINVLSNDNKKIAQYDSFTKSGLITLTKEMINENKDTFDDNYLLFEIDEKNYLEGKNYSKFSLEIIIGSKDNETESPNELPKNKYIRGSFDKILKPQNQIYYIDFITSEIYANQYILEFSSNSPNIELVFNNCEYKKEILINKLGFDKYLISVPDNSSDPYFTVRTKNTIKNDNQYQINYIMRLNEIKEINENDDNYDDIFDIEFKHETISVRNEKDNNYRLILKNNNKNLNNSNENIQYIYCIRLYSNEALTNNNITLNTITMNENEKGLITMKMSDIFNPGFEMSYDLHLDQDKEFIATIFVIVKKGNQENYYSLKYEFNTKKINLFMIFIFIIFCIIIVLIIIIAILIWRKALKENKSLTEKIQTISFSQGIDDSFDSKKSKTDEDYDTTFI